MRADQIPLSRGAFARMAAVGLDVPAVLAQAGLSLELMSAARPVVTTAQFFGFWHAVEAIGQDPSLGLRLGDGTRTEVYDMVTAAALHAGNLGEALDKLARYKRLTCPEDVVVELNRDEAAVSMRWMLAEGHTPRLLVDAMFASNFALAERGTGRHLHLRRLELTRRPAEGALLAAHFRCELRFNAPQDRIIYQRSDLELPFVTRDDSHLTRVLPLLEDSLREQSAATPLRDKVWNVLARGMRGGHLRMAQVADALYLSPRTLQRRLGEAGTSYQQVLDQVRHHLARRLLDATDLDVGEIAFLLGFEELNSFHRAFRQWEGATPARWRQVAAS
ncbi:AraC family transcriptional regulator [Dyella solisilvae]|uniref:AraC family transcriptional regulator n=1 Tax=Dyella solisilvae TaxID=1920168 RepID=A0A370K5V6_9GAMM|nr:AraC family transcriptional regulator [Dyella solisilvae]RDI97400.1 AraC family transcriptional regulator [Dyella solisilvae]